MLLLPLALSSNWFNPTPMAKSYRTSSGSLGLPNPLPLKSAVASSRRAWTVMPRPILNIAAKLAGPSRPMASGTRKAAPTHEWAATLGAPSAAISGRLSECAATLSYFSRQRLPLCFPVSQSLAQWFQRELSHATAWPLSRMLRSVKPLGICE